MQLRLRYFWVEPRNGSWTHPSGLRGGVNLQPSARRDAIRKSKAGLIPLEEATPPARRRVAQSGV